MDRSLLPKLTWIVVLFALAAPASSQDTGSADLDRHFEELMSGVRLQGHFNVVGPDGMSAPQPDLYMVSELTRGEGNTWIFNYRMSFNQNQQMVPVPVEVLWAGDTPVLTMTDQEIEGLQGKFSARILIDRGRYAGTWQHGPVGGHMWGVLEPAEEAP